MRRSYDNFRRADAEVVLVSFAQGEPLRAFAKELDLPFPVLSDPQRQAYRAYGLRKGGLWAVFGPKIVGAYLGLLLRGRRFRGIQGDPFQLGGDFIIDAEGIIRFAHRSADPVDRPSPEQLLQAVRVLTGL